MKLGKKLKLNLHGIGAKTTVSHMLLAILVILFASISTYTFLASYLRDNSKNQLLAQAKRIAQLETDFRDEAYDAQRMKLYETMSDSTVFYIDSEFVATHLAQPEEELDLNADSIVQTRDADFRRIQVLDAMDQYFFMYILSGESVAEIRSFGFVNGDIIFAGAPVYNRGGEVVGGMVLIQPVGVYREQRLILLRMLLLFIVVSIPLSILLSLRLSRRLNRPIMTITGGARLLAEGRYGLHIERQSDDEIGELADTLNGLSKELRHTIGNLQEERDKLDLIMNSMGEGIIAVDWYMRVMHCNQPFLRMLELGTSPEEADVRSEYGRIMQKSMKSGSRERAVWTDGAGHRLMALASPLHGDERIVIGAVCLVQDISEAERLEQMRRDYVANVSHELRTPLTGIRGMVEPLMDDVFDTEEEKQDCYRIIYKETIRLEKLIQEMLDLSRLQDGRAVMEMELLEADGIIHTAVDRVRRTAEEAGVRVTEELGDGPVACWASESRLLQLMTIFLDNAVSFTPSGGTVTAYALREEGFVRIGVRDTGCGIEPKDLPFIWERFYKVDKSRMRTKGTGLGLAIAKLVTELMHGEIGVNTEPGRGADFWVRLRATEPTEAEK